jgi:glycosyltransferase involved in cell wall biosynthesis
MANAQHAARSLYEADGLLAYVTTFRHRRGGALAKLLAMAPGDLGLRITRELGRRALDQLPDEFVYTHAFWEVLRTICEKARIDRRFVDGVWAVMSHDFDEHVADNYVDRAESVAAYEYTALHSFERAKARDIPRTLHLPSLDSRAFEDIQEQEKALWPELRDASDDYFRAKFAKRYERRRQEIELATLIVTNSSLTARSHIEAGADPAKVFAVPLACPPPIAEVREGSAPATGPLKVIWAGPFSLRKGAHYLLQAWQMLDPGANAVLDVYGRQLLPERISSAPANVVFHGSISQTELFKAYEQAHVLVFPTLSDGFGMVVAEAFAHGLPVITTERAGAIDLVSRDNGLLVPPCDPEALAQALQWCLANRGTLASMRRAALETAQRRQWSDFRREMIMTLDGGLRRAGYSPRFKLPAPAP